MKKLLLSLSCLLIFAACASKYDYYSDKVDASQTPADVMSLATDISTDKTLSSSDKTKLSGALSKHTAGLIVDKIKTASAERDFNAREMLEDAKEYASAVKDVLGKDEYKEIMAEYANTLSSMVLKGILQ